MHSIGHTILVTGANVGLGYWTAHHLAAKRATVILGCRSSKKCAAAADKIETATGFKVETTQLDLGSFASVRAAAAQVSKKHSQIDSLILNAGVMVPPVRQHENLPPSPQQSTFESSAKLSVNQSLKISFEDLVCEISIMSLSKSMRNLTKLTENRKNCNIF